METEKNKKVKFFTTKNIATLAVLSAASYILYMFVKFPLPFFPSFLDMQISDLPALIAGFMLGTPAGIAVVIFRGLLKLPFTSTAGVGELADVILGSVFVLVSSTLYHRKKTKKNAIIGLILASLSVTAVAVLINRVLLIPFYVQVLFGGKWELLLKTVAGLYPSATKESFYNFYLWAAVLPFNLMRAAATSVVTYLVYKSLSRIYKKEFFYDDKKIKNKSAVKLYIDNEE